tara:strand:+ start:415 stop:771 length:357 start_codon:yes stop_codon:yes gene_type:complete
MTPTFNQLLTTREMEANMHYPCIEGLTIQSFDLLPVHGPKSPADDYASNLPDGYHRIETRLDGGNFGVYASSAAGRVIVYDNGAASSFAHWVKGIVSLDISSHNYMQTVQTVITYLSR